MDTQNCDRLRSGFRTAFALFCAFSLCANLAGAIHEFGHALGAWLGGVRIAEWYLRPFDFSRVEIESQGASLRGIMLWSGGGIFFGVLLPLPLLLIVRRVPVGSLTWLILFMTVTLAFGNNGILLLQSVATGAGDPSDFMGVGEVVYHIPRIVWRLAFAIGAVPLLWVFVRMMLRLLRAFGPWQEDSYFRWVLVVEVGFLTYFVPMFVHTAIFGNRERLFRLFPSMYLPMILLLGILVLAAATIVYRKAGAARDDPAINMTPRKTVVLFLIACAVIGIELAFLGPSSGGQ